MTNSNFTIEVKDYEGLLDSLLNKKSIKYDIYFFDNIFTFKYGPHLMDLDEFLSKNQIDLYKDGVASKTCIYDGKWVALVIH